MFVHLLGVNLMSRLLLLLPLSSCTFLLPLRLFFTYTNDCHIGCSLSLSLRVNEKNDKSKQERHTQCIFTRTQGPMNAHWPSHSQETIKCTMLCPFSLLLLLFLPAVDGKEKNRKKSNFGSKLSPKQLVTCDFHLLVTFTKYRTSSCIHFFPLLRSSRVNL